MGVLLDNLETVLIVTVVYCGLLAIAVKLGPYRARDKEICLSGSVFILSSVNVVISVVCSLHTSHHLLTSDISLASLLLDRSRFREACLLAVAGFHLFDLCAMIRFSWLLWDRILILHHVVVLIAIEGVVYSGTASAYVAVLLANEVSTVPLNIRYFLMFAGMQDTRCYCINGLALMASFFMCRLSVISLVAAALISTWATHVVFELEALTRPHQVWVAVLSALLLVHFLLNCFWFAHVIEHARRVWRKLWAPQTRDEDESSFTRRVWQKILVPAKGGEDESSSSMAHSYGSTEPFDEKDIEGAPEDAINWRIGPSQRPTSLA
eukprot:CAMPEP_0178432288 /NCGR_PEP_ID=MMETSP0689_2-20121128/32304_1 /TAXON_ID=160604 /ORGANISM="Amphidinium massartii, Strain CS-259" /LENGTH=322 /DNA_ID=CAMNT_0020054263 /DNA_START=61 /DNA_END=1025 /DNA_ORIENTATION=-